MEKKVGFAFLSSCIIYSDSKEKMWVIDKSVKEFFKQEEIK